MIMPVQGWGNYEEIGGVMVTDGSQIFPGTSNPVLRSSPRGYRLEKM